MGDVPIASRASSTNASAIFFPELLSSLFSFLRDWNQVERLLSGLEILNSSAEKSNAEWT